ncbi:MAG: hypothetical protein GY862_09975 [Gammaproteobacteria bacterium]|nr:hypothetical protein [Gammaproteobacteria bacterium]
MTFNDNEILLPYQKAWLNADAQIKVWEKSRRIGASWVQASNDALYAAKEQSGNVWYLGQDKEMAQAYIQDIVWWAKEVYTLACSDIEESVFQDENKDILTYTVRFTGGAKVSALSSRPANLRSKGRPGERFTFDECAHHPDFEGVLKAAGALLTWGCKLRFLSSHNGELSPFNEMIQDMRAGKRPGYVHRTTFKEAFKQGLYKRICQVMTAKAAPKDKKKLAWSRKKEKAWVAEKYAFYGDNATEELDVMPGTGSGIWLPRVLIERCMVPADIQVFSWPSP